MAFPLFFWIACGRREHVTHRSHTRPDAGVLEDLKVIHRLRLGHVGPRLSIRDRDCVLAAICFDGLRTRLPVHGSAADHRSDCSRACANRWRRPSSLHSRRRAAGLRWCLRIPISVTDSKGRRGLGSRDWLLQLHQCCARTCPSCGGQWSGFSHAATEAHVDQ